MLNQLNDDFNRRMAPEILILAKNVLGEGRLKEIEDITEQLLSEDSKEKAIYFLRNRFGNKQKRPLYYLNYELGFLPEYTRDAIRYAGDYIDCLIKHFINDKVKSGFMGRALSLGYNLKILKIKLGEALYINLVDYNKFIYVPAKHDFDVEANPHRFSAKDAVAICLITLKLSQEIVTLSSEAEAYLEGKILE